MTLPKRYNPSTREPEMMARWLEEGVYRFRPDGERPVYSIDTPPPTVSGRLHLGHTYSYSHPDFIARFWRMRGYAVYYPMGFDDNGLPTERLVERREGVRAREIGREAFIERCLATGEEAVAEYRALWQRLGLSIDWRYSYRTIGAEARRTSQWSFLDLYRRGLAYRRQAPTIWCPTCHTAIAQAEVDDLERESVFYTLAFGLGDGEQHLETLPIATTRPELLPACVAVFIHPDDPRAGELLGRAATVPLFRQTVPILADPAADPEKGTGIVMCCTFGDTADVEWWYTHELPLVEAIGREGQMLEPAGRFAGLPAGDARREIVAALAAEGLLLKSEPTAQTVRTHERCDTPVEYMVDRQWFIRVLDHKETFLEAGEQIRWHPTHMQARYRQWVENLNWDWCISRQRFFGVPFPLWYCDGCGEIILAEEDALPVDPTGSPPPHPCPNCGGTSFTPETDVMDTWATSSMSPQIAADYTLAELHEMAIDARDAESAGPAGQQLFPYSLRPQAHEIIRTWAFYTIVKSHYHFGALPWGEVAISGWGLAPEGSGKISKSRGGGPVAPLAMIERHSADAVRYWAASTGLGKDSVIDEEKIQAGSKLITKLWNVARFSSRFLESPSLSEIEQGMAAGETNSPAAALTPADRWLLSCTQRLIGRVTALMEGYEHATAKSEIESYFWQMADNYLEMAKKRLYDGGEAAAGARFALGQMLLATVKLLAPFLPFVTEAVYQGLLETDASLHRSAWPVATEGWLDDETERAGETLLAIATAVRRYKSEHELSLGSELARLHLATSDEGLASLLAEAEPDLASVTRAGEITVGPEPAPGLEVVADSEGVITVSLGR